jgi:hypothetical protein
MFSSPGQEEEESEERGEIGDIF